MKLENVVYNILAKEAYSVTIMSLEVLNRSVEKACELFCEQVINFDNSSVVDLEKYKDVDILDVFAVGKGAINCTYILAGANNDKFIMYFDSKLNSYTVCKVTPHSLTQKICVNNVSMTLNKYMKKFGSNEYKGYDISKDVCKQKSIAQFSDFIISKDYIDLASSKGLLSIKEASKRLKEIEEFM